MKKSFLRVISVILCAVMFISAGSIGAFAADKRTDCGDDCEFYPTIIIPGLGQSSVCVTDENGEFVLNKDDGKISAFPAYIQLPKIIKTAIVPLLLTLITQRDMGLSKAAETIIMDAFGINRCDLDAQVVTNVKLEQYNYSYAECNEYERSVINSHIPFNKYHTDLPKDHLYYFSYNSFENHIGIADRLYNYIQMVKKQTGHDKVNIVPISQGGTVASAMFEYHPEIMDQLHKVIFIVPALDGSTIIGDVFNNRITFLDTEYLYNGFFENLGLLDAQTAKIIEIALRILPDEVLTKVLKSAVTALVEEVMIRSTSMWALCPSGDYESAAELRLSSPEMASIKEQTYKYYQAQLHFEDNLNTLLDKGVQVFNVAEYDFPLINVGETWNSQNADYIIQVDSTSMGAYLANIGETLPEDYVQKNTHCSNPDHNHISPDRVVDASAGLLPDTTFYFDGQRHDLTQHNNIILEFAFELIAHDDIQDVYSDERFPQFNIGRDVRIIEELIEQGENADTSKLSAEDAAAITDAVDGAKAVLSDFAATAEEYNGAVETLKDCLVKAGIIEAEKVKDPAFFGSISAWLYKNFGTNGFSEFPGIALKKIFSK